MGLYTSDAAYISPRADDAAFVPWLIDVCNREGVRAVLSGVEPVVAAISAQRAQIEAETGAVCLVSPPQVLAVGDDKLRTCQWLEAHGLNTPRYADGSDRDAVRKLAAEAGYPLIAKPRGGKSAEGILTLRSDADADYIATRPRYVVEEMLGDSESEYTVGCFVDRNGMVRGSIAMRRSLHQGTTVFAQVGDYPDVRAEAERIAAALKPVASCNVQMRVHLGRPVTFEINVRFSGTTPMRARFGFNEVEAALRHYVLGEDVTPAARHRGDRSALLERAVRLTGSVHRAGSRRPSVRSTRLPDHARRLRSSEAMMSREGSGDKGSKTLEPSGTPEGL
ncbi:MAG: ATP-grasp domain-containing protein [Chloroflexi bacterium]|nr:ATP-grasp domain-containing protein [Chloroflexota bacterium]